MGLNILFRKIEINIFEVETDSFFENALPALKQDEISCLEKNIIQDGRVRDPFVVWKNPETGNYTLIDGHHRLSILRNHSDDDIPYNVQEGAFKDKAEARMWVIKNGVGRRNMTDTQVKVMIAMFYDEVRSGQGASDGFRGNQYVSSDDLVNDKSCHLPTGKTARQLTAEEFDVSEGTVENATRLNKSLDIAEGIKPGFKNAVLSGQNKAPQSMLADIQDVPKEQRAEAVEAVMEINADHSSQQNKEKKDEVKKIFGRYTQDQIDKAEAELEGFPDDPFGVEETEKEEGPPFTEWAENNPERFDPAANEIVEMGAKSSENFERFITALKTALETLEEVKDTDFSDEMFTLEEKRNIVTDQITSINDILSDFKRKADIKDAG